MGAVLVQMGDPALGAVVLAWGSARVSRTGNTGQTGGTGYTSERTLAVLEGSTGCTGEQPHPQHVLSRDTEVGTMVTRGSSAGSCRDLSPSPVLHFH